jgi:cytoskeleton protein RodZ
MPIEAMEETNLPSRAGEKLRAARERLGIDRGELSLRTKINERHLAAVEDSDFAALPARIYAVGFARSYAGAVGLDGGVIAAQVRRELNEQEAPANQRPAYDLDLEDPAKVPSKQLAWLAAALGIALVVAGTVFWRSYFVPAVDLPPVRENVVANSAVSPDLSPAAALSPTAESAAGVTTPVDPTVGGVPAQTATRQATLPRVAPRSEAPASAPTAAPLSQPAPQFQPSAAVQTPPEPVPSAPAT